MTLFSVCCSFTVEPEIRVFDSIKSAGPLLVFVTANRDQGAVEDELRAAGLSIAPNLASATVVLRANIGSPRSRVGKCGAVRNVMFDVRESGKRVVKVKARGWVGPCEDRNTLREMSVELAQVLRTR